MAAVAERTDGVTPQIDEEYLARIATPLAVGLFERLQAEAEYWVEKIAFERMAWTQEERAQHKTASYQLALRGIPPNEALMAMDYLSYYRDALPYCPNLWYAYDDQHLLRVQLTWNFHNGLRPDEDSDEAPGPTIVHRNGTLDRPARVPEPDTNGVRIRRRRYRKREPRPS